MPQNPCPVCSSDRPGLEDACPRCGWRPAVRTPALRDDAGDDLRGSLNPRDPSARVSRAGSIWWAYLIAPVAAPASFAAFILVFGLILLGTHSSDTGSPVAIVAIPTVSLTVGVAASYLASGIVGMPIVVLLERRNKLDFYTIQGAALASSLALFSFCGGVQYVLSPTPAISVAGIASAVAGVFVFTAPFVLVSGATFWWIVVRGFRGLSLGTLLAIVTLIAVLLALSAPVLRVIF